MLTKIVGAWPIPPAGEHLPVNLTKLLMYNQALIAAIGIKL